ncbi:MAG TPA: serine/threonine-protein kinase [Kofleriaceae bacterium]|nr:serine/threonine-protein kinase [Kofleriaceae bacterium]
MLVIEAEQGERLRLGHVLGNYRLIRKLGEGGVGTVYEGEHIRLGRKMALKVLHPETASAEVIVRFFNEARAVNQIRHPNIVDVEDFVTAETGEHYLIMELLAGEDLRTIATREGVLDPRRVAAIGEQIASALGAIHGAGIVHRDIKPDNIYVCRKPDGTEIAKLIDFGIAKFLGSAEGMTREGMTLGTPEYMAPEQILSSGKPGPAADLYSLGMLMYECVSGAPAFTATTTAAILRGHISEPVVPPSLRRGEPVPPVLEAAILKCLEKDPKNRFASGDELATALRAERAVDLITPRFEPGKPRRKSRALQMLPAFAMAAAAAVLHFLPKPENQAHAEVAAAPTPAPVAVVEKPAEAAPAPTPTPPPPAAPKAMDVALTSSPDGAELYMGEEPLGPAPQIVSIPISSTAVELTARFDDGVEVVQTIVPDRPLPQIAFVKPAAPKPSQAVAVKKTTRVTRPTKAAATKAAPTTTTGAGTMTGDKRDGTMDPFK